MNARDRLRQRLALVAVGIDRGRYIEPEDAAEHILEVLESIHGPHRDDLLAWVATLPEAPSRG